VRALDSAVRPNHHPPRTAPGYAFDLRAVIIDSTTRRVSKAETLRYLLLSLRATSIDNAPRYDRGGDRAAEGAAVERRVAAF